MPFDSTNSQSAITCKAAQSKVRSRASSPCRQQQGTSAPVGMHRRACTLRNRALTLPSRGRATSGFAGCRPPLMSNVRPPRRHMTHRHAPAKLPSAKGAVANSVSGCPSAGGQRANRLVHRALSQSPARPSESRMAQRPVQRLKGLQRSLQWSLAGACTFASRRRPNPSVKRTSNGGPRSAVSGKVVPPLAAAYLIR